MEVTHDDVGGVGHEAVQACIQCNSDDIMLYSGTQIIKNT